MTATVAGDLPCVYCEYNLRSLATAGVCPECGRPVAESLAASGLDPRAAGRWALGMVVLAVALMAGLAYDGALRRGRLGQTWVIFRIGGTAFDKRNFGWLVAAAVEGVGCWLVSTRETTGRGGTVQRSRLAWALRVTVVLRVAAALYAFTATALPVTYWTSSLLLCCYALIQPFRLTQWVLTLLVVRRVVARIRPRPRLPDGPIAQWGMIASLGALGYFDFLIGVQRAYAFMAHGWSANWTRWGASVGIPLGQVGLWTWPIFAGWGAFYLFRAGGVTRRSGLRSLACN